MKRPARLTRKQKKAKKPAPALDLVKRFAPVLDAAKKRFPDWKVEGVEIQNGAGYAITIADGVTVSQFQVRSKILIDGKPVIQDVTDEPEETRGARLAEAFNAIEKANKERTAQVQREKNLQAVKGG